MTLGKYINLIANIDLFKTFTKGELVELFKIDSYHIRNYKKDQVIHFQNEICTTMDIILIGQAAAQNIDEDGNILTVSTFTPTDIMGANLIFATRNSYPMTVIAKSDVTILHIHRKFILELCQSNTEFLKALITVISDKAITLTDKINSISLKTIRECIIDFLTYEYHIQKTNVIKLNMTKKEMAERLGIQRPSLSRELNKMRTDGLIEYDAKTITIKDMNIIAGQK